MSHKNGASSPATHLLHCPLDTLSIGPLAQPVENAQSSLVLLAGLLRLDTGHKQITLGGKGLGLGVGVRHRASYQMNS